jgi:uncharacterized protein YecE (DUF72 family)
MSRGLHSARIASRFSKKGGHPQGFPQHQELAFAAERFDSIELNGSFYSLQRPESYERWYASVPPGFLFAIRGSRYITHMLRLQAISAREAVAQRRRG